MVVDVWKGGEERDSWVPSKSDLNGSANDSAIKRPKPYIGFVEVVTPCHMI